MTNRTAALRYARALLEVVLQEHSDPQVIESQLVAFVDLFRQYPSLEKVLLNPAVPAPRKRAAVSELTKAAALQPILSKLLILLAERDRLALLNDLVVAYRDRLQDHLKIVRAIVTTSVPLSAGRAEQIERALSRATGRTVTVTVNVDPSIIGGLVARIGGTVYDASLTMQLRKMKERLSA